MASKLRQRMRALAPRWMGVALGDGPGGIMLRWTLAPAIALFAFLGWLHVQATPATVGGTAALVLAASALFGVLGWRCARVLEELETRLMLMADAVPSLVWTSDARGLVTSVNRRWEELTGMPGAAALRQGWLEFVHPEDRSRTEQAVASALAAQAEFVIQHRFRAAAGDYRNMLLAGRPHFGPAGEFLGHLGSSTDITMLEGSLRALAEGETRLRLAIKASNVGLWDWNLATNEIYYSPEWKAQLGYADDELPNRFEEWESRLHPDDRERMRAHIEEYLASGRTEYQSEFRLRHRDGSYRSIYTHAERVGAKRMLGCHVDVTELKRAETEVRSLTRRLLDAEESERRALSRELHDRVGQNLSALTLNLQLIRQQLSESSEGRAAGRLEEVQRILQATAREVRDVMVELRPPGLDDYGLATALRNYAERMRPNYPARLEVKADDPALRLPQEVETALFRIAQEALANTAKHAAARKVEVRLQSDTRRARLTISDDGSGFDPSRPRDARYGLATMRERAAAVGGELAVETAPGRGTRLTVEVPRA